MITSSEWCALPASVESNKLGVNIKLGIENISIQSGINLYPNPNTGSFTLGINTTVDEMVLSTIFNSLDQVIYSNTLIKNKSTKNLLNQYLQTTKL